MSEKRSYFELNKEEQNAYAEYNSFGTGKIKMITREESIKQRAILLKFPAIKNYDSLFPNNYLNNFDIKSNKFNYLRKLQQFDKLLEDNTITERNILNFIQESESQFIISSTLKYTNYGHHDRYIFTEISLPPNHRTDFLIVGKNSHGYHFLLVELENPYSGITLKDGNFGTTIRKGLIQIDDWKAWIEKNFTTLKNVLSKLKDPKKNLPNEFFEYDSTRFQYVIVAGRRNHFKDKTYLAGRKLKQEQGIILIHYDNLIDEARNIIEIGRY